MNTAPQHADWEHHGTLFSFLRYIVHPILSALRTSILRSKPSYEGTKVLRKYGSTKVPSKLKRYLRGCISEVTTLYTMAKKVWKYFRKYKYLRMYFWKYNTGSPTYLATFEGTKLDSQLRKYFQSTSEVLSYEGNVNAEYMKYHHI
eukprot:31524-Pelagococcus_subviridis.AAC.21